MSHENFISKEATQQIEFLKKYPEYDGRGIKIAIIDTDIIDINLPGMQKTTTGLPKIIDCFGKHGITVDTSATVNEKEFLNLLSGRKLKIPSTWTNPSSKWHIGSISFNELYDIKIPGTEATNFKKDSNVDKNRFDWLKDMSVDCIVWFNDEKWQAAIPLPYCKNLKDAKILKNGEIVHLHEKSIYCIKIDDDGNSVQLFCPLHCHATEVAHIAAAYFPDASNGDDCNGLASGAQIVSLHWKNLEEALLKCIELKVDIVNFSVYYSLPQYLEIKPIIKKMVEEHGIIITKAGGNLGPLYSSIREQLSEISEHIFLIGSILTADVKAKFGYPRSVNSVQKYSSKGPLLASGARGINFVAPGDAITDLPKWYPNKSKRSHGTSLAAPNAAGSIACLLSALKANSILYSPEMIKMALAKTAFLPKDADQLAIGYGIMQICDAFEFIKSNTTRLPLKFLSPISIDDGPKQKGIIFYKSKNISIMEYRFYVNIDPTIDTKWILQSSSNHGGHEYISYQKICNFFIVKIDASLLKEDGSINYAEIHGIDPTNPSIGPLFYLPITVICPADAFIKKEIILKENSISHFFFKCPLKFRQCCITFISLNSLEEDKDHHKIILEYRQKKAWHNEIRAKRILDFTTKIKTRNMSFEVEDDVKCFEICIYHKHSNTLNFKMSVSIQKIAV